MQIKAYNIAEVYLMNNKCFTIIAMVLILIIGEACFREILHYMAAITGTILVAFCIIYSHYNEKGKLL